MASGWRVVSETVKQKWKVSADRAFRPTSNLRNEYMFKECTSFADKLRKFEKDMVSWQKRIDGSFTNLTVMMHSYLPVTYDEGTDGAAAAMEEPRLIGENTDTELLAATSQDFVRRVQDEVIRPVTDWLYAYKNAQDSMAQLESLRLDLDSRRRTVDELQGKYDRHQAMSTNPTGVQLSPRQINDMQQTYGKMRHKEEKLQAAHHHFQEMEKQVYEQMCGLIEATVYIKEHMLAFVCISKDCFTQAYTAVVPGLNNNNMLPQHMAGLRINTSPKQGASPMPSPRFQRAPTPTKKIMNTIGSAASALKGLVSPRKGSNKFFKSPSGTPRASPYQSPATTPRSPADPYSYYQEPVKPAQRTQESCSTTPRSSDVYGKDAFAGGNHTPRGSSGGKYTAKDGYPSPLGGSTTPRSDRLGGSDQNPFDKAPAADPYSDYQPPAPQWASPTSTSPQYVC